MTGKKTPKRPEATVPEINPSHASVQKVVDADKSLKGLVPNSLSEALEIVQHARSLEVSRGRTAPLPEGAFGIQRLLIAVLESMPPEQRAEVKRRLGQ